MRLAGLALRGLAPPSELEPAMTDLRATALTVLVTWLPLLLVVPCFVVWVILLRGELRADDDSAGVTEAGPTDPTLPRRPRYTEPGRT
jgi:hypothetical protein